MSEVNFEEICKTYPDIPSTILLKTEVLRLGVKLSPAAQQTIQNLDIASNEYDIFGQIISGEPTARQKVPSYCYIVKDNSYFRWRTNVASPYLVDVVENKLFIYDERLGSNHIEEVKFVDGLKTLSKKLDDGTPYGRVATQRGKDALHLFPIYYCEFWKDGTQCLFCDSVTNMDIEANRGVVRKHVTPEAMARVVREAFNNEPNLRHLSITGGTILDTEKEMDFYCSYLNAINEVFIGASYPSWFQIVPKETKHVQRLHDTGIGCIQFNFEVWDERLFNIICPGKAKYIGRDEYIKRATKAVDIFGRGNILMNFVTGVEMSQPWGFKDPVLAVKSTLDGFEFLMSQDVLPRMDMWCVMRNSSLRNQNPAPLEYYINLEKGYSELLDKYNFSPFWPGNCRYCDTVDTLQDWQYYFHS